MLFRTVTKLVSVADVGTPLNPKLVEAQISGAAIMQLGFTMTENMIFKDGQLTNGSLADYKIPGLHDLPAVFVNAWTPSHDEQGPFGAKGAGESSTIALSPAIGNALADAVGIEPVSTPLMPEAVFTMLRDAGLVPQGGDL